MSNTICIIPWTNFVVGPDGAATFCCEIHDPMTVNGAVGNIARDSLESLWNAPEIVDVRAKMAAGEKPEACRTCWRRESAGGMSRRLLMNAGYRDHAAYQIEKLPEIGATTGYKLDLPPTHFILEMGNVCNLRCRSCVGALSSRISADRVHSAWTGGIRDSGPILVNGKAWFHDTSALADMLATAAETDIFLTLMGGEPFLIPSVWQLLTALVERGVAKRIYIGVCTNGQHGHPKLAELAPHFRGFNVSVSVDAYGKVYEYMRNGASWSKLLGTLDAWRELPGVNLCVVPTLQNYNALDLVRLFRMMDEHDTRLMFNIANQPLWLAPTCLPPGIRRLAERRLQNYLDTECKPQNVDVVRAFRDALGPTNDAFDPAAFEDFMTFTNDLDASRDETIREAIPELFALLRSAGIEWSNARRHTTPAAAETALAADEILTRVNRSVSDMDYIFPGFEQYQTGLYFSSAVKAVVEIDELLRQNGHDGLAKSRAVADVASHYGRITRALRAALPDAAVYACDIDPAAVQFCVDELGALPVIVGWRPEDDALPTDLDAIVCFSLLTHTTLDHWRRSFRAWARMLRPGGVAAFTYLSERRLDLWLAGDMAHYGDYSADLKDEVVRTVAQDGFGFASLTSQYGNEPHYGVTFVTPDVVRREIEAAGLEVFALPFESPNFGQELAVLRRPGIVTAPKPAVTKVSRDVSLVALYDPRGYAEDDEPSKSAWVRLVEADPPRPLPTSLGFADPRVADVREAQAELAARHGIDAFCYRYFWDQGPRWDAPLRAMLSSGRPDLPFAVMLEIESSERISTKTAMSIFEDLAPAFADPRYLRVDNRLPIFVAHVDRLAKPRATAVAWRKQAKRLGLGDLHLCTTNLGLDGVPEDYGFDSFLEPPPLRSGAAGVAASLTAVRAGYRTVRTVRCARDAGDAEALGTYEEWLHAAVGAARTQGEPIVVLDAWNDWSSGAYLEPDDRSDSAALDATRRATRGPLSGLVLLRRLRDALSGSDAAEIASRVDEIEHVMATHERSRGRLQAAIEASLALTGRQEKETARWVHVSSRHLPPSPGHAMVDYIDGIGGTDLHTRSEPVALRNANLHLAGWAHDGATAPELVDFFIALESCDGTGDRIFRVPERLTREHVVEQIPGYPPNCGFEVRLPLDDLPAGTYNIAFVHRSPDATFRDLTPVVVTRAEADCSSS